MKEQFNDQQKKVLSQIDILRVEKETLKKDYYAISNAIHDIDVEILRLRQSIPALATPETPKRHRQTPEERLAELEKEADELRSKLKHD